MTLDRPALVESARESIELGSKSFALASKLFAPETRERAWLLYAWCRACDDIADGQDHGHGMQAVPDAAERVERVQALTDRVFAGEATGEAPFDALGLVAAECAIPKRFADDVIAGFRLDGDSWSPASEDDLYRYCYYVAGAVGCMMAVVMGVDPDDDATLDRACDLGLAFQLANIARDVAEDAGAGRCYLPTIWLQEAGIEPAELMAPENRATLVPLVRRLCHLSEHYEASARYGANALPFRSRWAVLAAAGIYGDIARAVRASNGGSLDTRTVTSKAAKAAWVAHSLGQAMREQPYVARDGLWSRPR